MNPVLLIDGDAASRPLVSRAFEELECELVSVSSVRRAFPVLTERKPAAIFLNLSSDDLEGLEVLLFFNSNLPQLICYTSTGAVHPSLLNECERVYSVEELLLEVQGLPERSESAWLAGLNEVLPSTSLMEGANR